MTVVAVAAAQAAPGVSTLALGLAATWPDPRVRLVEADGDGGVIATRFGLPHDPGLATLAASHRNRPDVAAHTQRLHGGLEVLVLPPGPAQARSVLTAVADKVADVLHADDVVSLVDVGRGRPESHPAVAAAAVVLLVLRSRADEVAAAAGWLATHHPETTERTGLVVVDVGGYPAAEVAAVLDVPLRGVLPHDAAGAARFYGAGSTRRLGRAPLVRACRSLAADLATTLDVSEGEEAA